MATNVLTDFSNALTDKFGPNLYRQFFRLSVLASILPHEDGKGRTCAWDVQFSGATVETFNEGADATNFDNDLEKPASLDWARYRHSFALSGTAQAAVNSYNQGDIPEEFLNLINDRAMTGAEKLAYQLDADCFNGAGGNAIVGLETALATTGTYANLSKVTYSEWRGTVLTNSGVPRALTKSLMDQLEASIFDACGMQPNVIVASSAVCRKYESLFDANTRVQIGKDLAVASSGNAIGAPIPEVASGYTGLTYKGIPVYRARNSSSGKLWMLNTNYIRFQTLPRVRSRTAVMSDAVTLTSGGVQKRPLPWNVRIDALAKTGDADKFTVLLYPALKVARPNTNGYLADIDET